MNATVLILLVLFLITRGFVFSRNSKTLTKESEIKFYERKLEDVKLSKQTNNARAIGFFIYFALECAVIYLVLSEISKAIA